MAEKRIIGGLIASVLLSVTITGGLSYLALPIIFPSLGQDVSNLEERGIVLQAVYEVIDTPGNISDSDTTYRKIPDTHALITVQNNSRISVTFSAIFMLVLDSADACAFNISIVVNGYGNQTYSIVYLRDASSSLEVLPTNFHTTFLTDPLPEGTYLVEVYWKSYIDQVDDNYLFLNAFLTDRFENPRTLVLLELA